MTKTVRIPLIILTGFLAVTAAGGAIGLLTGWNAPPVESLGDSPFRSYLIPGLALLLLVGGPALISTVLLVRRNRQAWIAVCVASVAIIVFESVEVAVIGSPAGLARNLQVTYFSIGVVIGLLALISRRSKTWQPAQAADPRN